MNVHELFWIFKPEEKCAAVWTIITGETKS